MKNPTTMELDTFLRQAAAGIFNNIGDEESRNMFIKAADRLEAANTAIYDLQMADTLLEFIGRVQGVGMHHDWNEFMDALTMAERQLDTASILQVAKNHKTGVNDHPSHTTPGDLIFDEASDVDDSIWNEADMFDRLTGKVVDFKTTAPAFSWKRLFRCFWQDVHSAYVRLITRFRYKL